MLTHCGFAIIYLDCFRGFLSLFRNASDLRLKNFRPMWKENNVGWRERSIEAVELIPGEDTHVEK